MPLPKNCTKCLKPLWPVYELNNSLADSTLQKDQLFITGYLCSQASKSPNGQGCHQLIHIDQPLPFQRKENYNPNNSQPTKKTLTKQTNVFKPKAVTQQHFILPLKPKEFTQPNTPQHIKMPLLRKKARPLHSNNSLFNNNNITTPRSTNHLSKPRSRSLTASSSSSSSSAANSSYNSSSVSASPGQSDDDILSQKDVNVESMVSDNLVIKRQPLMGALTVKGEEKPNLCQRPFRTPRQDPSKIVVIHSERKRGRLGVRNWRRVDLSGGRFLPQTPTLGSLPDLTLLAPLAAPVEDPVVLEAKQKEEEKVDESVRKLVLWTPSEDDLKIDPLLVPIDVPMVLCKWLREHQREGVQFMALCVLGQANFDGAGCILADDMGLGKTLQSIALLYTLLVRGFHVNKPHVKRAIIVCPTSLVSNWFNELAKWLQTRVKALAATDPRVDKVTVLIDQFLSPRCPENVLIVSYETYRRFDARLNQEGSNILTSRLYYIYLVIFLSRLDYE